MPTVYDVIVIGAGISGLKSAIDLNKNGLNVIILEARDRLGGRLHTEDLDGFPVDLGASWFHDCLTNPLFEKNLSNPNVKYYFDDGKIIHIGSQGELDIEPLQPIVEEFFKYVQLRDDGNKDDSLHNWINRYILEKRQFLTKDQIELVPQLVRFIELWFGSCWDQTSGLAATEMEHEGRNAFLTTGYYSVYEAELKEFPNHKIYTNKVVNKIEQLHNIRVDCIDGTTYFCKNLIVTIPQPCLTSNDFSIPGSIEWKPELPKSLTNYFPKMSFAALGKVAFEFPEVFWSLKYDRFWCISDIDKKSIDFLNRTGNPLHLPFFPENGVLDSAPESWKYPVLFVNVAKFSRKPIIILLIQAPITHYIEWLQSTDKVWEYFEPFFKQLGDNVTKPKRIIKTNWTQDPFARGSYTGGKVGGDYEGSIKALIKGLPNVRFAGEHTIFEGNGCAHGAWLSGKREAAFVLKKYNKL